MYIMCSTYVIPKTVNYIIITYGDEDRMDKKEAKKIHGSFSPVDFFFSYNYIVLFGITHHYVML